MKSLAAPDVLYLSGGARDGEVEVLICVFIYSCLQSQHLPGCLDWSDCFGCLQCFSWNPDEWQGHGSRVAKLISTAICGLKFVTLGTVKFLRGSPSTAFVSLLWECG